MIKVVQIEKNFIFPIFKNGRSSILYHAQKHKCKWLLNQQVNRAGEIIVFLREPKQRIISGIHSFIEFEKRKNKKIDYDTMLYIIDNHGITNEHFELQIQWIKNLAYYYKGDLVLKDIEDLDNYVPIRKLPGIPKITEEQKNKIAKIVIKDIDADFKLYKNYIGKKIQINKLVNEVMQ